MTGLNWVDAAVLVGVLLVAVAGWRAGIITTVASFAGFIAGALVGAWLVPQLLVDVAWAPFIRAAATVAGMFVLGLVGQSLLGMLGRAVRDALDFRPVRFVDSASGMVVSSVAFLVSAWLVLSVAASIPQGAAADHVRASRAFSLLEQVMEGPGGRVLDDARALIASLDLPSLPFNPATLPPVTDPGDVDIPDEVVDVARTSVLQVSASSSRCMSSAVGSAVVVAPGRVATNAHVVAGAGRITVRTAGRGPSLGARLIHRDAATDLAILYVPDLAAPAPDWVEAVERGEEAAVAGFPGGGPLKVRPARVRGEATIADDAGGGTRDIVVVRGVVQPGNSGGPVLDMDGRVLGLVFANASMDESTGFALAPSEVLPVIEETRRLTTEVSSGACPAR